MLSNQIINAFEPIELWKSGYCVTSLGVTPKVTVGCLSKLQPGVIAPL